MTTSFGFIGGSDSSGQWFASTPKFFGDSEKLRTELDQSGTWFANTVNYMSGPIRISPQFIGQSDANGEWFSTSNTYYFGTCFHVYRLLIAGFVGATFMKNVFILTRDYWTISLSSPYVGQIFPTGGNSGGPGQVYPF